MFALLKISGGSSGIGKEVAKEALKLGANVTLLARNVEKLENVQIELKNNFPSQMVSYVSLDLCNSSVKTIRDSLDPVISKLGPIKVLVHCAGYSYPSRAHQIPEEEVRQLINVNYLGSVMLTQALLPDLMNLKDGGAIIFTSSLAGLTGVYGLSAYCGSKFAIRGYAESLAMGEKIYSISNLNRTFEKNHYLENFRINSL